MATDKNITMKQFNGTDYDTLYPKTIASQIPDVYSKSYIDSILKDSARIQTGSYVGTGTYGVDNPCTLTFNFIPKLFYVQCSVVNKADRTGWMPYIWGSNFTLYIFDSSTSPVNSVDITTSENIIYWYASGGASSQFNSLNVTYNYIVIG